MSDEEEPEGLTEIEFFSAHEDADLRLRCFDAAPSEAGFAAQLKAAQELYNWVMGFDDEEGEAEPTPATPEDKCERRH